MSIPAEEFVPAGEAVDLSQVTEMKLTFDSSGEAAVDNIGLEAVR